MPPKASKRLRQNPACAVGDSHTAPPTAALTGTPCEQAATPSLLSPSAPPSPAPVRLPLRRTGAFFLPEIIRTLRRHAVPMRPTQRDREDAIPAKGRPPNGKRPSYRLCGNARRCAKTHGERRRTYFSPTSAASASMASSKYSRTGCGPRCLRSSSPTCQHCVAGSPSMLSATNTGFLPALR